MKPGLLIFTLCAALAAVNANAAVYKWIDADGKVQYGDAPPKSAKAAVVSGGVTVVPALVAPPPPPASPSQPAASADASRAVASPDRTADANPAPASTPQSASAVARAEARLKAIEQCRKNRGIDCEDEVDGLYAGQPALGNAAVSIPGWSQPPIRPSRPPMARSGEQRPTSDHRPSSRPQAPSFRDSSSAPAVEREAGSGHTVIKAAR